MHAAARRCSAAMLRVRARVDAALRRAALMRSGANHICVRDAARVAD